MQIHLIDLSSLGGVLRRLEIHEKVDLPSFGGFDFIRPVDVDLQVERASGTVMVVGSADVAFAGDCDRCLARFESHRVIDVDEKFAADSSADPFGEGNVVRDDRLDLTDLIRQVVDAALPLVNICKDECAGLCATCGGDLNEGSCKCSTLAMKGDHG